MPGEGRCLPPPPALAGPSEGVISPLANLLRERRTMTATDPEAMRRENLRMMRHKDIRLDLTRIAQAR